MDNTGQPAYGQGGAAFSGYPCLLDKRTSSGVTVSGLGSHNQTTLDLNPYFKIKTLTPLRRILVPTIMFKDRPQRDFKAIILDWNFHR